MQEYMFLLPISLFLLLGVMSPGPSFLFVAQVSMAKSRAAGVAVSLGMGLGSILFAVVASLGLFVLLQAVPWLYLALKVVGGCYLCYLAYKMWNSKGSDSQSAKSLDQQSGMAVKEPVSLYRMFWRGLTIQLSNPKTAIVFGSAFAAFLPQQIPDYSYALLSVLAFVIDTLWYVLVALILSTVKAQRFYRRFNQYINRLASGFMAAMGIKLIVSP